MAGLFGAGAVVCIPTLLLRPWSDVVTAGVLFNFVVASATAISLYVFRAHVGTTLRHVALTVGIVAVALSLVWGGGGVATALYSVLYLWIGVYVGAQFSAKTAVRYLVFAMVTGGAALAAVCSVAAALTIGITTLVTAASAALVVGILTARVQSLANCDPLTGLPNRRALTGHLEYLEARRRPKSLAVITLDLDGFKSVNDEFGHAAGDDVLVDVAENWSVLLRDGDVLARVGGDEFIAVLDDCDTIRAEAVAERLVSAVTGPVTVSVGLVCCDGAGPLAKYLARSDEAVYRSKAGGGGVVTALNPSPEGVDSRPAQRRSA